MLCVASANLHLYTTTTGSTSIEVSLTHPIDQIDQYRDGLPPKFDLHYIHSQFGHQLTSAHATFALQSNLQLKLFLAQFDLGTPVSVACLLFQIQIRQLIEVNYTVNFTSNSTTILSKYSRNTHTMASQTTSLTASGPASILPGFNTLPAEGVYSTQLELPEAMQSWAKPRGYALVISCSKLVRNNRKKVYYSCDLCKTPPSADRSRTRKTSSEFQFSILTTEIGEQLGWELNHRPEPKFSIHNDTPNLLPAACPSHRQMSSTTQDTVNQLIRAGK
jgi:hypothetical protein